MKVITLIIENVGIFLAVHVTKACLCGPPFTLQGDQGGLQVQSLNSYSI
jgi:hypothetical protein